MLITKIFKKQKKKTKNEHHLNFKFSYKQTNEYMKQNKIYSKQTVMISNFLFTATLTL